MLNFAVRPLWPAVLMASVAMVGGFSISSADDSKDSPPAKPAAKKPQTKEERDQSDFMRKKLGASNQILEGLVTEDAELIKRGAKILIEMSSAERWQVKNNVMYKQYSNEFLQSAKKLEAAAEKENIDAVTLKWMDTTMKCVECHKFVRSSILAQAK
ncbi:hypothetical protein [Schlesneria paludicola]|uniref:hypothetical protein n=1 Tax=Schlesneria paludicola TaxID=360056 RepID=UPI00029A9B1B|nr:hypothetical protein [Schlesneria paludicola]